MKKFGEFIKETPTNSSGDGGFSGSASSPVAGYDKTLWSYMVTNAYQSPMDLSYRWSNIFPVKKLSLEDIDDMVDASKEFVNYMNRSTLTKKTYKEFKESTEAKNKSIEVRNAPSSSSLNEFNPLAVPTKKVCAKGSSCRCC